MTIDIPVFISFAYFFTTMNLYGWGILSDKRFITFSISLGIFYILSHSLFLLGKSEWGTKFKVLLIFLFIGLTVFASTISIMQYRNKSLHSEFINDSALQIEIAGRYLLLGMNPYANTYIKTDLAKWRYFDDAGGRVNPALFQNVHPPFLLIISALEFRVFSRLFHWYDIRIIYLLAYFSLLVYGVIKFKLKENLLLFLILALLNPLFVNTMIQGTNDIVILAFLLWSIFFIEKRKYVLSGLLLGLALATKQTAWFALPFYLLYVWKLGNRKNFLRFSLSSIILSFLFYLPFILWNLPALFSSLVLYVGYNPISGKIPIHPIEGYGFGMMLYSFGILKSIYSTYPFFAYQSFFGLLTLSLLILLQRKHMSISSMFYSYTVFIWIIWFFNRYFLVSHLAYLMVLIGISYVLSLHEQYNKISDASPYS